MKNVEEWFMIRELARQGLSITEIARRVGCDRKTIRKHLAHPEPPGYKARPPKLNKLDPFKLHLDQRLERGVFNCEVLYRNCVSKAMTVRKRFCVTTCNPIAWRHATKPACGLRRRRANKVKSIGATSGPYCIRDDNGACIVLSSPWATPERCMRSLRSRVP